MQGLVQDIRSGFRFLMKAPLLSLLAIAALAIGIGAVTCAFAVANGVLMAPLPFREPDRLLLVYGEHPMSPGEPLAISAPAIDHMLKQSQAVEGVAASMFALDGYRLDWKGADEPCVCLRVTAETFGVLGVAPAAGRFFLPEDDLYGAEPTAVISHRFWLQRFGGDPSVVGAEVLLDRSPCTIVGVLPEGFYYPVEILSSEMFAEALGVPWRDPDIYLTVRMSPQDKREWLHNPLIAMARIKPGVDARQFERELNQMWKRIVREYIGKDDGLTVGVESPATRVRRKVRGPVVLLVAATALILFAAWANVASLVLTRSLGRRREAAIRTALGGTTGRLIRQVAVEGVVLAVPAGLLGILLAWKALPILTAILPIRLPRSAVLELDVTVLAAALVLSTTVGLLLGIVPIRTITRRLNLQAALNEGSASGGGSVRHSRLLGIFVVAEIAVAVAVVWCGALLGRSLMHMQQGLGFDTDLVFATNELAVDRHGRDEPEETLRPRVFNAQQDALARVRALPGVNGAALTHAVPVRDCPMSMGFLVEGADLTIRPHVRRVSDTYFDVMGIPLVRGRVFGPSDRQGGLNVAICSERFARRAFPDGDAVGKRVLMNGRTPYTIVGMVKDVYESNYRLLSRSDKSSLYLPATQAPPFGFSLVARIERFTPGTCESIRSAVANTMNHFPEIRVDSVTSMRDVVRESVTEARFAAVLGLVFGGVALVLAAAGTYGVMAYWVAQRSFEVGIRMALGAAPADILKHVLRHGAR
ncbi:MAG: FtsX-like permease family protein, partial [bacterium]|nr:FtsX-like permease family protein [bacterium]